MEQLIVPLLVVVGIVVVAAVFLRKDRADRRDTLPYRLAESLLSPAERSFYGVLGQAVLDLECVVLAKVRLGDLLWIPRGTTDTIKYRNRIQQKHLDFVLCRRENLAPVLAIELDDTSHERSDRQDRDAFVEKAYASAGLPLLRMSARRGYSPVELAGQIRAKLGEAQSPIPGREASPSSATDEGGSPGRTTTNGTNASSADDHTPICPRCGGRLVGRTARQTRGKFLGCSNYPSCRYRQPLAANV